MKQAEEDALAAEAARLELLAKQQEERQRQEEQARLEAARVAEELMREQELIAATVSDYLAAEVRLRCMMQTRVAGRAGGAAGGASRCYREHRPGWGQENAH